MKISRRVFMGTAVGGMAQVLAAAPIPSGTRPVPVVDITDLYHPPQDPGDNMDLIMAYALPEVDLRAVILDVTQRYRRPYVNPSDHAYDDPHGQRDPGFIPVAQLNAIFGRNVPCAAGPFEVMRSPDDEMRDAPAFQQAGIELLLRVLRESPEPVEIVSFGSLRPLAVAYNRAPGLMRRKTRCAHIAAGAAPPGFLEWNVQLDVHAFVRVLRSDLPLAIYPCAAEKSAFDLGMHNTYWQLPDLSFIRRMRAPLRNYLVYAIERSSRVDFLNALEEEPSEEVMDRVCNRPHNVWETVTWMAVANRQLVRRADGRCALVPAAQTVPGDTILPCGLIPCGVAVRDDGQFDVAFDKSAKRCRIFRRGNPEENQQALREAMPALYTSF